MVKVRKGKAYSLKAVLDYIQNPAKTDGGLLVSAQNCLLENAFNEMMLTKNQYHKTSGRQYAHIIQAFSVDDPVMPELAHKLGEQLLAYFPEYEGIVSTHIDKRHVHNHIVLNSVNHETGQKWQMSATDLQKLKEYSDKLCLEHGLSVIKKDKKWRSKHEISKDNEGRGWKKELSTAVAYCIKKSASRAELVIELEALRIGVEFRKNQLMFTTPWKGGLKCGSDKLLPYGDFTKKNIDSYLIFNAAMFANAPVADRILGEMSLIAQDLHRNENCQYEKIKPLSALEGQALKDAIYNMKLGRGYDWDFPTQPQEENTDAAQTLVSIDNLMRFLAEAGDRYDAEMAYRARREDEYDFELNYDDEEEDDYAL